VPIVHRLCLSGLGKIPVEYVNTNGWYLGWNVL
jgi:hypothetical protein